jgi:vitamin B12/bleomycin/antimicrobial peptide transport system ATP-binding/permease protein
VVGAALAVNRWNKYFFDALERRDVATLWTGVALIAGLVVISALAAMGLIHMRTRLQVRWRQWLTRALMARWLSGRRFYQLSIVSGEAANPEARMSEDARLATELLVDFAVGALNAIVAVISFAGVLWVVGGGIHVGGVYIPGYMVLGCALYSAVTTFAVAVLGRLLVQEVERKTAGEARFRDELTRVRESAENIALIGGEEDERSRLSHTFADVIRRWRAMMWKQGHMTWITAATLMIAPVAPLLLGAPKYLAGDMSLGSLMQAAAAFVQVQAALNWIAENALRLADWFASARRVSELNDAFDRLDATISRHGRSDMVAHSPSPDDSVHLLNVRITQHDGRIVVGDAETVIAPGQKVLVRGDCGSGKSTLIRAIAGLWPWGSGEIQIPPRAKVAFLPQQPYFPPGSLRAALLYPNFEREEPQARIADALTRCGLAHLIARLDETDDWRTALSAGEQQRVAFARVLLAPPDVLVMDEPTSALDEESEARMMDFLRGDLAHAIVIHVCPQPGLERFHDRELHLLREDGGQATAEKRAPGLPAGV